MEEESREHLEELTRVMDKLMELMRSKGHKWGMAIAIRCYIDGSAVKREIMLVRLAAGPKGSRSTPQRRGYK